jgi:UTP--glucose-1-phosphate uridylyltransferase
MGMSHTIRKAVIPVAGLGTRMFPASKAIPKEMLTIVDRPIIEWIVDEAREAGIEQFVFITARNKSAIEDHFDTNIELDQAFARKGSLRLLEKLHDRLPEAGSMVFTRQQKPLGLGHAIWCARHIVGREAFAVLLPDMVMTSSPSCLAQMMSVYNERGGNIIATETVPQSEVRNYGILDLKGSSARISAIHGMVEKPEPEIAPSTAAISGRYILQPDIFDVLAHQRPGSGGEIQLTDALLTLMQHQEFWAYRFDGHVYDCGSKLGYLMANVAMGLQHRDVGDAFTKAVALLLQDSNGGAGISKAKDSVAQR